MNSRAPPPPSGKSGPGAPVPVKPSSTTTATKKPKDPMKKLWCDTQWTNISHQARALKISTIPYFNPETMLLSKEVNEKLWTRMGKLYDLLGPQQAPFATAVMIEGGEVKWYSYIDNAQGDEAVIYNG